MMRRHPGPLHRQPNARTSLIAAGLILGIIIVIAVAASSAGTEGRLTYPLDRELTENYLQVSPVPQESTSILSQASPSVLDIASSLLVPAKPKSSLAPKLQPNVLSSFSSSPVAAIAPSNPEQTAFVQAYQQLKPTLSVTSYIPLSHQATRGIILPAGKSLRLGSAYVALQLLRDTLHCDLPVEIWHVAGEIALTLSKSLR